MLGQKLRELRETKGLMQRQVAETLQVDTAYFSKIESNEKPLNRLHVKKLAGLLGVDEKELMTLWLADKVFDLLQNEPLAEASLLMVRQGLRLKDKTKKVNKS
jgi:HTH-type transcriptional regulator, competence development regulator